MRTNAIQLFKIIYKLVLNVFYIINRTNGQRPKNNYILSLLNSYNQGRHYKISSLLVFDHKPENLLTIQYIEQGRGDA